MEILNRAAARRLGEVRLVGQGKNEIVMIVDALRQAEDLGLDLVLVSEDVRPPVVRIEDFKKIEYEKKKAKKATKHISVLKEIQFKLNISEHDLVTKVNKINEFLSRGDKVKIQVKLKGRERDNPERAHQLLERVTERVECKVSRLGGGGIPIIILEPTKVVARPKAP